MSNSLLQNPVILTSSMSQSFKAATLSAAGSFQFLLVKKIIWAAVGASGDSLVITDGGSTTLLTLIGQGANIPQEVDFVPPIRWRDFQLTQISSGTVSIFLA